MAQQLGSSSLRQRTIADETVLRRTRWCTVREQETEYLVYNNRTDELHLIPPAGMLVYWLCDGAWDVGELTQILASIFGAEADDFRQWLERFLGQLLERGIIEVASCV